MPSGHFLAERREELGESSRRLRLLEACCDVYDEQGLLPDGCDAPLHAVCPCREPCWGGRDAAKPDRPDLAGIAAPWIGERYFEQRIVVLGMNFDAWGGLSANWDVCGWHIEAMKAGHYGKDNRFFAYGAMSYVAAVHASLAGTLAVGWAPPEPTEAASLWEEVAFLQAVKCAPRTERSNPFTEMFENCPELLLRHELELLDPAVVLILGRGPQPRDAIRPALKVDWAKYPGEHPGHMERDRFELDGRVVDLFSLNHPSAPNRGYWQDCLDQLTESLRRSPLPG